MKEIPRVVAWGPDKSAFDVAELVRTGPSKPEGSYAVRVDFEQALEWADGISVQTDLRWAVEAVDALISRFPLDQQITVIDRALWTNAIILYGRAFDLGVRHRYTLSPDAGKRVDDDLHTWLVNMRDKYYAHSVNDYEQIVPTVILAPADGPHGVVGAMVASYREGLVGAELIEATRRLLLGVLDQVDGDIKRLEAEVARVVSSMSLDQLYAKPPYTSMVTGEMRRVRESRPVRQRKRT
jgi:hypothetical protein